MGEIRLTDVHKTYPGGHAAVRGVDLRIADGEFLVLVGPSGCGKSTTLRLVAGLETPTAGTIAIGERDVTRLPPQDRDIAMVFQSYALYPHKTVRENLAFPLRMHRVAAADIPRRIDVVAHVLGLDGLLDKTPRQLSGGQRQRVALGRAIVREPQAFLLDEPLSNLDAKLRVQTRAELARIHRRLQATMLYVTHDQEEAMTLGDRVAVMHGGRLQQVAPPLEVYRRPANVFVAGFIGSPAMNFLACTLGSADGQAELRGPSVRLPLPAAVSIDSPAPGGWLLGVRPQDVALVAVGEGDAVGRVEVVEPLGPELLAHVAVPDEPGAEPLRVVVPTDSALSEGVDVGLRFRRDRLHLFARETGERVGHPRQ
jgi:multiple sugar transport system ATP-binding protein